MDYRGANVESERPSKRLHHSLWRMGYDQKKREKRESQDSLESSQLKLPMLWIGFWEKKIRVDSGFWIEYVHAQ